MEATIIKFNVNDKTECDHFTFSRQETIMDYYQCLRTFCDVTELGSFSKTAKKRYLSPSAVSKQIDWLEARMKIKLITRSTRQLVITPAGKELYQLSKKFLQDFNLLQQYLSDEKNEIAGKLKITAPVSFGECIISEWVNEFVIENKKICIEFVLDNHFLDLMANEVDVAIRSKLITDSNYTYEKIANTRWGVFAAPSYLTKNGIPKKPADLKNHRCISHSDRYEPFCWTFKNDQKINISGTLQCNNNLAIIEAAKAGAGLIHMTYYQAQKALDNGDLIEVLRKYAMPATPMYLCYSNQRIIPKKTSAFCDFLRKKFKAL